GSVASINAQSFYAALTQPSWAPPPWLFGPVWTALFTMMAVSVVLVWRKGGWQQRSLELSLFIVQLVLNGLWSWLFFAWNLGGLAFFELGVLWFAIAITIVLFWRVRAIAGILLVPYLLWVTFAGVLNLTLWQLNPDLL
ncbi:MAG: TspO/MBR family protein, partial [Pseudomonadota bacterium]